MPRSASNPFTPDRPVTEEECFFGREDILEWLEDSSRAGQRFLLLYGTPRAGKTSLLFRLRSRLELRGLCIYLDLESSPLSSSRDQFWLVATEVHRRLIQDGQEVFGLPPDRSALPADFITREVLPLWRHQLRSRPLFLLLDGLELSHLREGACADLLLRLQELAAQEIDLFVMAAIRGSSAEAKEPIPALRGLPFQDLDLLTEVQTEEMLSGLARYQLGFDYDALRRIHVLSGGHPYLLQVFGAELFRHLAPLGQVTLHAVNDMAPMAAELTTDWFARQWEALSPDAQATLAAAGSLPGYRGTVTAWDAAFVLHRAGLLRSTEAVEQNLRELCDRRVMRWLGGSAYTLPAELWRSWLAAAHPLAEVLRGKQQPQRPAPAPPKRHLSANWSAILLWIVVAAAILTVGRVWSTRGSHSRAIVPLPTLTQARPTPRPTATRVALPGRIAYMAQATAHDPWCIWSMRDNGTDPVRLTDGTSEDTMPAWSPDGQRIAFISTRSGNRDVWVMNADGSDQENITRSQADEWTPAWSPDGTQIAFASSRDGNWELYVAKPDGSAPRRITWSPAADYDPSWSPDGGRLAFVSERDGNPEIYVVNRDGSGLQRLTENQVADLAPRWSPDGTLIAFETYRDGNWEIYTMAPDGSNPRNVSNQPESDEHGPSWSPDGKWIAYYGNRDGSWDIYIMLADGTRKTNLTMGPAIEQAPVWQPRAAEPTPQP